MSLVIALGKVVVDAVVTLGGLLALIMWDAGLHIANYLLPAKRIGAVVPQGTSGHKGYWGEYKPPSSDDARSPCPALNALANHGILPRNGRGFTWKQLGQAVQHTYNLSPTLCIQVPWLTAKVLFNGRDWNDQMTLDDLNAHGAIEHDASYARADVKWQPDQSTPNVEIIEGLYKTAGFDIDNLYSTDTFQLEDFAKYLAYRRAHSKVFNNQYLMNLNARLFSCINSVIAFDDPESIVFAGNAADLKTWLVEERIPHNWEPKIRSRYGFTIARLNHRSSKTFMP
ncbi:peroxidase family 2 domain protein [Ceratobasidium sp. AG-Ba]|nr:peroxidase family 2 domain protein [Ceratobasidium sp. AG-Ba]